MPNSHFPLHIRDDQVIPATTEINRRDFSMTTQDTLQYGGMGIPDSYSLVE